MTFIILSAFSFFVNYFFLFFSVFSENSSIFIIFLSQLTIDSLSIAYQGLIQTNLQDIALGVLSVVLLFLFVLSSLLATFNQFILTRKKA